MATLYPYRYSSYPRERNSCGLNALPLSLYRACHTPLPAYMGGMWLVKIIDKVVRFLLKDCEIFI